MTEIISKFVIPFDKLNDTAVIEMIEDNIMHAASLVPSGTNVELVLGPKAQDFFLMNGIKSICNFDTFYMSNILADNEIQLVSYTKCDYSDNYKIFKISGYLLAPLGSNINENTIKSMLTCVPGKPLFDRHLHVVGKEIEDWNPDLPINQLNCDMAACESYFKDDTEWPVDIDRTVVVGGMYKHFKGKVVKVITLSQDTETPGQFIVVYQDADGYVWHRPLGMFLSEVDHVKYPNVKQKYRFELMSDQEVDEAMQHVGKGMKSVDEIAEKNSIMKKNKGEKR